MVEALPAILLVSSDFSHPHMPSQQYAFSWRLNRLRPLSEKGHPVIVICAGGKAIGGLRGILENAKPSTYSDGKLTFVFPPILKLPGLGFLTSFVSTPITAYIFCLVNRVTVGTIVAASVAYGAMAKPLKKAMKAVFVVDYGDPEYMRVRSRSLWVLRFLERYVFSRPGVDVCTCMDPVIGEHVKGLGVADPLFLPPGGFWKGRETPSASQRGKPKDEKTVIYAGHVGAPPYRLDLLVEAAPAVFARHPSVKMVIVGDGEYLVKMRQAVAAAGLGGRFVFKGRLPYDQTKEEISRADVCLQLLDDMCLGTKVMDYFSLGKPVVSCGAFHDSYRRFLTDGQNCLLVAPDSKALATAINRVLSDPKLGEELGDNAYKTAAEYDWETQADLLWAAVSRVGARSQGRKA